MIYTINFDRIKKRKIVNGEDFKGVYFNDISANSEDNHRGIKYAKTMKTLGYPPILLINESVPEHFTQILFILKESFTDKKKGFIGWQPFTEKYLTEICEKDYVIYKSEWGPDGNHFIKGFPEKIKEFILQYCSKYK